MTNNQQNQNDELDPLKMFDSKSSRHRNHQDTESDKTQEEKDNTEDSLKTLDNETSVEKNSEDTSTTSTTESLETQESNSNSNDSKDLKGLKDSSGAKTLSTEENAKKDIEKSEEKSENHSEEKTQQDSDEQSHEPTEEKTEEKTEDKAEEKAKENSEAISQDESSKNTHNEKHIAPQASKKEGQNQSSKDEVIIECKDLTKKYSDADINVSVIKGLSFSVKEGESICIYGASGSGKSSLLHLLGGLDTPTSGEVFLMGQNLKDLSQRKLGELRNKYLGFVYQFHHLLQEFSALENVMMPLLIYGYSESQAKENATSMLDRVGLRSRIFHRPNELSGGERQRVSIARALVNHPRCILADEPTGNLDKQNARSVLSLMLELQQEINTSIVVVTHDEELAQRFDKVYLMDDGKLKLHPTFNAHIIRE